MDAHERRRFVFPDLDASGDSAWADPADEDERRLLIEAEHPELQQALEDGRAEVVVAGRLMNPALHIALHGIVATQLWDDEPDLMWRTAVRLTGLGYDRHDVLHMLMTVVGEDVRLALAGQPPADESGLASALDALPESWEQLRAAPATNRAERRAVARRRRR